MVRQALLLLVAGLAVLSGASAAADVPCSYIIQGNDTLFDVGKRYGLTLDQVTQANPEIANVSLIQPGDIILLPCGDANATSGDSVLDLLAKRADTTTLFRAIVEAGLQDELSDPTLEGTVFAPNNTAFENLLARVFTNATLDEVLSNKKALAQLLAYHVVPGDVLQRADLVDGLNLTTLLEGEYIEVFKPAKTTRLSTSSGQKVRVVEFDLKAGKAVVHITKGVLLPSSYADEVAQAEAVCEHIVVEGDTLFNLAKEYDTSVDALLELNPQLAKNPTLLSLGAKITISADCSD